MIAPRSALLKAESAFDGLKRARWLVRLAMCGALLCCYLAVADRRTPPSKMDIRTYPTRGIVRKIDPEEKLLTVSHEAIPSYMSAMTMPFKVRATDEINGLRAGDLISFCLSVTDTESWIDHIVRLSVGSAAPSAPANPPQTRAASAPRHPLLDYAFTNELGQPVHLGSFEGQVLAITFFFTRCPIPEYCPRLSRNFAEASQKLLQLAHGPTNWHFLSVSFDPEYDTPPVLKAYAENYHYDARHWSFLTGPKDKIAELARLSDVNAEPDSGLFNHNFRTLIIDASGKVQMVFPISGDLSEAIVSEVVKAADAGGNKPL